MYILIYTCMAVKLSRIYVFFIVKFVTIGKTFYLCPYKTTFMANIAH